MEAKKITSEAAIEEIRASRRRMSEEAEHDPAKLIEYLKTFNSKCARQVELYRKEKEVPDAQEQPNKPSEHRRKPARKVHIHGLAPGHP